MTAVAGHSLKLSSLLEQVEVFIGGGRVAAVMAYQPPNEVANANSMQLDSYSSVHLFAAQPLSVANVVIHQMGCGWNQTSL